MSLAPNRLYNKFRANTNPVNLMLKFKVMHRLSAGERKISKEKLNLITTIYYFGIMAFDRLRRKKNEKWRHKLVAFNSA